MDINFQLLWVTTNKHDCWILWYEYSSFWKKLPNCLPKWLYHFAFPPAMHESSCSSTSLPALGVVSVPDFDHFSRYIVESHCCFNLHFPDDICCGAAFHKLICHLYIFFGNVSVQICGLFLIRLFVFLLLNFKRSLYNLDNSPLTDVSFANIFSQSVACILMLVTLFFAARSF